MVNDDPTCIMSICYCKGAWKPREMACDNGYAHEVDPEGFHRAGREEPKWFGDSADGKRFTYDWFAETSYELNHPPCSV